MSVGLFGKKLGMTQIFDESGSILPVTLLKTEACQVSQIKTTNTDGYNAIQVAYCEEKLNKITNFLTLPRFYSNIQILRSIQIICAFLRIDVFLR